MDSFSFMIVCVYMLLFMWQPNGQRQPLAEAKPKASRLHAVLARPIIEAQR
jgi:hypothetical protein